MYRVSRLLTRANTPSDSRIMHAIKAGWAKQTFAISAKSNDNVEKKSGVRLSKKDRRVMVESFIKTYQKLNNGSFPSIHVTHKEVGGSYYIVREIVRDLIQENKVLAPPKQLQTEHKMFNSRQGDYPFGSISVEPQVSSTPLSTDDREPDHVDSFGEVILEAQSLTDPSVDDKLYIGQSLQVEKPEEVVQEDFEVTKLLVEGLDDSKEIKLVNTVEQEEPSVGMVSNISEAVEVETFPLPASVPNNESEDAITKEAIEADVKGIDRQKVIISHSGVLTDKVEQYQEVAVSESATSSNIPELKNLNGSSSVSVTESNWQEATIDKVEALQSTESGKADLIVNSAKQEETKTKDDAGEGSTDQHRDRNPTLNRINLESWEEISKKPALVGNPFAGFVKACVTAFSNLFSK